MLPPMLALVQPQDAGIEAGTTFQIQWLATDANFGATPITLIDSVQGLVNVVAYLDARRALG